MRGLEAPIRRARRVRAAAIATGCLIATAAFVPGPSVAADDVADLSVSVQAVKTRCFRDRIEVTGVLAAREIVDVAAEPEGARVTQVLVEPLDEVSSGQVLARLVPPGEPATVAGTPLRSPAAGLVIRSGAVVGTPVSSHLGPLFRIAVGGEIDLEADAPLATLEKLATGQEATVTPLGLPAVAAKVGRIEPGTAPATQLGRVRIGLGAGQASRIGTFARAVVEVGERCGLAVPYASVTYDPDGTIVHVVNGTRVEARQVVVGLLSGADAEIRSGLTQTDLVVVRAGAFVREGDLVNPVAVSDAEAPKR